MADKEDGEVGRRVVGAMVVQRLAAGGALIAHLEVSGEQLPCSATGAALCQSAPKGLHEVAGWPCRVGRVGHALDIDSAAAVRLVTFRPDRPGTAGWCAGSLLLKRRERLKTATWVLLTPSRDSGHTLCASSLALPRRARVARGRALQHRP